MTVFYLLTPLALVGAAAAVLAFIWATKSGQLDDLETPALRMLDDDELPKARAALSSGAERTPPLRGSGDRRLH